MAVAGGGHHRRHVRVDQHAPHLPSESRRPSHAVRVMPSESCPSRRPSHAVRVTPSESRRPSHAVRVMSVTQSKSCRPSHAVRVTPSERCSASAAAHAPRDPTRIVVWMPSESSRRLSHRTAVRVLPSHPAVRVIALPCANLR